MKKYKSFLLGLSIFVGVLSPSIANADSLMLNKEVADSAAVFEKSNDDYRPIFEINNTNLYNLISEDEDYYKIEYDGKEAYVDKDKFYKLNHTCLVNDSNLKKDPSDDSENMTSYTLRKDSKLTILEFVGIDDFVKVSYDQGRFDNEFINVKDKENKDMVYKILAGAKDKISVPTETIGKDKNSSPELVTIDDSFANKNEKIGYVHFKDLAISYRSQDVIDEFVEYYRKLNESKTYTNTQIFDQGPVYNIENGQRFDASKSLPTIDVYMTGSETGINLYSYAVNFLGNPYVFGGEDLYNGIDCSGFTMRVYETIGIALPHFAQSQQRYGVEVPLGAEQAGDLVFFGTSLNNITHVGIADGYGNMVHASSPSTGIIISPIYNPISIKRIVY